jgi:hypothetical protein
MTLRSQSARPTRVEIRIDLLLLCCPLANRNTKTHVLISGNQWLMGGVYNRVGTRLRFILPLIMGTISVPLVIWDIHNTEVIYSVGMGWDTGAPVWPYRTPEILLWFLKLSCPCHCTTDSESDGFGRPKASLVAGPPPLCLVGACWAST